jgi:hypothetical protein
VELTKVEKSKLFFRNMNDMWSEMSEQAREEYKEYFIRYHNEVARWQFHKNLFATQFLLWANAIKLFLSVIYECP